MVRWRPVYYLKRTAVFRHRQHRVQLDGGYNQPEQFVGHSPSLRTDGYRLSALLHPAFSGVGMDRASLSSPLDELYDHRERKVPWAGCQPSHPLYRTVEWQVTPGGPGHSEPGCASWSHAGTSQRWL